MQYAGGVVGGPVGSGVVVVGSGVVVGAKTHGPPPGPLYPALQVHASCDVLPNGECELAGQAMQVEAPVAFEYFPTEQNRHSEGRWVDAEVVVARELATHAHVHRATSKVVLRVWNAMTSASSNTRAHEVSIYSHIYV